MEAVAKKGGLNQYASQILDLEQFVAEVTDRIPHCEEISRSHEKPCENQSEVQDVDLQ